MRYSYGDGYVRTPRIVLDERLRRPFNHLVRDRPSREFAESVWVCTRADILEESPSSRRSDAGPGEPEFYRDHRANEDLITDNMLNYQGTRGDRDRHS